MPTYLVRGLDVDKVYQLCQALPSSVSSNTFNADSVRCCYIGVNRETHKIGMVSFKRKGKAYPNCTEISVEDFLKLLPTIKLHHALMH